MTRGIQFSISSDDPGLFGYEGVTLDYVYATAAWELSIRDLKKCSLNGIKYASVSEEKKADLLKNHFEPQWKEWIDWLNNLTVQKAE
jgi:adenosine deaminase CECR1